MGMVQTSQSLEVHPAIHSQTFQNPGYLLDAGVEYVFNNDELGSRFIEKQVVWKSCISSKNLVTSAIPSMKLFKAICSLLCSRGFSLLKSLVLRLVLLFVGVFMLCLRC